MTHWKSRDARTKTDAITIAEATDSASCTYPDSGYDCAGECLVDSDNDGTCDAFEVNGCTDGTACNYNALATEADGTCTYPDFGLNCAGGCAADTDGDDVCDAFEIDGCDDSSACNYDSTATDNDGSCSYPAAGIRMRRELLGRHRQ